MSMLTIERQGPVAIVTFDRGERRNALSLQAMQELTRAADAFRDDTTVTCVVLTGTAREFSSGVDLKDTARWNLEGQSLDAQRTTASWGARMCRAWEEMPQVTIAAVEGLNVGGGIALTLACDWRVIARGTRLLVPEAQIGIPLVWQTVPRLVNAVGASRAKQIILLGEEMDGAAAKEWGLADWVCDDGMAKATAVEIATKAARTPAGVAKLSKQCVNAFANALNNLGSFADVDQALLFGQSSEAKAARSRFAR